MFITFDSILSVSILIDYRLQISSVLLILIEVYNLISIKEPFIVNYMTPTILIMSYVSTATGHCWKMKKLFL